MFIDRHGDEGQGDAAQGGVSFGKPNRDGERQGSDDGSH